MATCTGTTFHAPNSEVADAILIEEFGQASFDEFKSQGGIGFGRKVCTTCHGLAFTNKAGALRKHAVRSNLPRR